MKLKLQYFGYLMRKAHSPEKTLMLGKIRGQKEKRVTEDEIVGWNHQFNGYELGKLWEIGRDREAWGATVQRVAKSQI